MSVDFNEDKVQWNVIRHSMMDYILGSKLTKVFPSFLIFCDEVLRSMKNRQLLKQEAIIKFLLSHCMHPRYVSNHRNDEKLF